VVVKHCVPGIVKIIHRQKRWKIYGFNNPRLLRKQGRQNITTTQMEPNFSRQRFHIYDIYDIYFRSRFYESCNRIDGGTLDNTQKMCQDHSVFS